MLKEGDSLPAFSLQNQRGETITNKDLAGDWIVLYFYPKDDTPGCTKESCGFRDLMPEMPGARIIGVSPDGPEKHVRFIEKYDLPFDLIADPEKELIKACGFWVEKSMYGKKYMGVERSTLLIDPKGKIHTIWRKAQPAKHPAQVKKAVAAAVGA